MNAMIVTLVAHYDMQAVIELPTETMVAKLAAVLRGPAGPVGPQGDINVEFPGDPLAFYILAKS